MIPFQSVSYTEPLAERRGAESQEVKRQTQDAAQGEMMTNETDYGHRGRAKMRYEVRCTGV
jgi:hypothetical protein